MSTLQWSVQQAEEVKNIHRVEFTFFKVQISATLAQILLFLQLQITAFPSTAHNSYMVEGLSDWNWKIKKKLSTDVEFNSNKKSIMNTGDWNFCCGDGYWDLYPAKSWLLI